MFREKLEMMEDRAIVEIEMLGELVRIPRSIS